MKALVFGEILWDIYHDKKFIGGAALNFAAHFSRCGGKAYMLSAVGRDSLADESIYRIEKMGVSTKYISRSDKETGKCLVTLDEKMIPAYKLLSDVAYDYINTSAIIGKTFDLLYFGSLALRSEYNMKNLEKLLADNSFAEIVVDINIRSPYYSDDVIKYAMKKASIIKISDEEIDVVEKASFGKRSQDYKIAARKLSKLYKNLKIILITRGEKGAYLYNSDGEEYMCSAVPAKLASTVGAGDSFAAAFVINYIKGESINKCLEFASKVSSFVVSNMEAVPDYEIDDLISY